MKYRILVVAVMLPLLAAAFYFFGGTWRHGDGKDPVVVEATATTAPGEVMQLAYRIGELDLDEIAGQRNFAVGEPVYVTLRPGRPYWRAVSVCREYPVVPQGDVALRGRVIAIDDRGHGPDAAGKRSSRPGVLRVSYGIERLAPAPAGSVAVRLAVDSAGTAEIEAVTGNGS